MMPDVEIPILSIVTVLPRRLAGNRGARGHQADRGGRQPDSRRQARHVHLPRGLSAVVVEFNLEVKINEALPDARAKINGVTNELPIGIQEPIIQKLDFAAMPIVSLASPLGRPVPP